MGFFGSMKDTGTFLGHEKTQGFFWVLYFSLAQIDNNISAIYCWCRIFLSRQILKLEFLGYKYEPLSVPLPPPPIPDRNAGRLFR